MTYDLQGLHRIYCQLTGLDLSMRYDRERAWYEFAKAGFTGDDLKLVILHLKRGIKSKQRHSGCLKFSNLIECLNYFEEEVCEARAHLRGNRPQSNRENIIQAFRPEIPTASQIETCKPAKEVVEKLIEELKKAAQ